MAQTAQLTQSALLALVRRITPLDYTAPLEANDNSGWEIHEAQALQMARASLAVVRFERDALILQASGAAHSAGEVTFSRASYSAGAVTLRAGTIVEASGSRRWYRTSLDAEFGATALGPVTVPASAVDVGYGYDCPADIIDAIAFPLWGSATEDSTIVVTNADEFTGGNPAALDALGWERRVSRGYGEADESLRERIRTLPDVVSPDAIQRLLERYSQRYDVVIESAETCGDGSMDLWADDECYADDTTGGVLDAKITHRAAFFVKIPDIGQIYDPDNYIDDDCYADDACYVDDWDAAKAQVAASILEACRRVKAAGVQVVVLQIGAPAGAPVIRTSWS